MTVSPTYADTLTLPAPPVARPVVTVRRLVKEQAMVAGGQALSGAGNMVFILAAAHSLGSRDFAHLATFLALYLLMLVPTAGLAAGAAAAPEARRTSIWALRAAAPAGLAIAAAAVPIGAALNLPWALVALLGASLPSSAFLAIIRGRLYGAKRPAAAVGTLVTEPAVRLGLGLLLLQSFGAVGAASGVVLGGYLALAVGLMATHRSTTQSGALPPVSSGGTAIATATATTFTALTLLTNLDVVLANRILGGAAGSFAAVSTLGGISAFATATIPLVLLPRMRPGAAEDRRALVVALIAAVGLGGGVAVAAALAPGSAYSTLLGDRYAGIGAVAVPYLAAMALLGIARLLAARLCQRGRGRLVTTMAVAAIVVQVGWILLAPHTAAGVAAGTEVAIASLTMALGVAQLVKAPTPVPEVPHATPPTTPPPALPQDRRVATMLRSHMFWLLLGLTVAAAAVRLVVTRGLWVDEATSIFQAHMGYAAMLHNLRTTDVHPPGYFTVLWLWVRAFGFGPLSVRMPSILMGIALVPAMFGLARDLFDRRTAVIAASFTVLAPQTVWYSQEARMYSMFLLLAVLSVWAQVRVFHNGSPLAWLSYTLATAALVYTQYFTTLVIVAQQLVFVAVFIAKRRRREPVGRLLVGWLLSAIAVAALVAPLVPFAHQQFSTNQSAGRGFSAPTNTGTSATSSAANGLSAYTMIANLLWAAWGYHSNAVMKELGALWPAAMLVALAMLGRGRSRSTFIVATVAAVPIGGLFLIGRQKQFLFDLRYFVGIVPMIVVLGARAAATWPRSRVGVVALTGVLMASLGWGLWDQQVNGDNPRRYDFKPALQTVAENADPGADVVLSPGFLENVADYYESNQHYIPAGSSKDVGAKTRGTHEVFLVGSFFTTGTQRQTLVALQKQLSAHRKQVHFWTFDNVKVWEYK
jgi:4-amino-4-deoxy-L-arabinose transferase-like glycosyltransferase